MTEFGLKLWSTNKNYVKEAIELYQKGYYQYIELYSVPNSFEQFIEIWENINIPFIIHATHFDGGMNFAKSGSRPKNRRLIAEAFRFADKLKAPIVIFHPGADGDIKETVSQLKDIKDKRIVIENKPYHSLVQGITCQGSTPKEIQFILDNTNIGFCLDISHAICSANSHKVDPLLYIQQFLYLKPNLYHLTDGDYHGELDQHKHLGKGNFPLGKIINLFPNDCFLTVETEKNSPENLTDFVDDIKYIQRIIKNE